MALDDSDQRYIHPYPGPGFLWLDAHAASRALVQFRQVFWANHEDLTRLPLDVTDPLVAEVEAFVKAYRKLYGGPVKR